MRDVDAREVLATGLRRAIDPRVLAIAMLTSLVSVATSFALHALLPDLPDAPLLHLALTQLRALVTLAPSALGSAAMLCVVLAREREEQPTFVKVLTRFAYVYIAQLFGSFALGFGIACFIIPMFVVGIVISVITPVALEEGVGPLTAWSRCRALIEGRGDAVTRVVLTTWMLMALVIAACMVPFGLQLGFVATFRALNALSDPGVDAGLALARFGYGAIWAGVSGVLYVRLRERELPSEAEKIARVFA